ncbi:hypothetical protein [Streptomyces sp. NPDC004284]|uniref:hypothetical protein n=1 Tax=Streptomyces sp. NPDC004284 TaxID=3364695 RepID=UPI0036839B67
MHRTSSKTPPSLDSLMSEWLPRGEVAHLPATSNFWGGVGAADNVLAVRNLTLAPYLDDGGDWCALAVDGVPVPADAYRWSAHEITRRATTRAGVAIRTSTRLAFEANRLLLRVTATNPATARTAATVSIALDPRIAKATTGWAWDPPRPEGHEFTARSTGSHLMVSDGSSPAVTVLALAPAPSRLVEARADATAEWRVEPARTVTIDIVVAFGETSTGGPLVSASDGDGVLADADATAGSFREAFAAVHAGWQKRWQDAFTPGNAHYSGSLPVLTTDDEALSRLYHMGVLSVLVNERTNLGADFGEVLGRAPGGYSGFDRVYVTGAPEWANTVTYFWDTSYCSVVLALLDPAMLKAQTRYWLASGIHDGYAVDCVQGGLVGPWYSANDLTVFTTILNHLDYSGDRSALDAEVVVGGESGTLLHQLKAIATHWRKLVRPGQSLADYGADHNLLEVLPNYVHQVPSFNAANVWMLRRAAALCAQAGDPEAAAVLGAEADALLPHVLDLYDSRNGGVWSCRHEDGTLVPVRTVVDFVIAGNLLARSLTEEQKTAMKNFVATELLAGDWMRALSREDALAPVDRADHGTEGAFDSWPALTAQTFARFGDYPAFLALLRRFSGVTGRGPFGQSHQLRADDGKPDGGKPGDGKPGDGTSGDGSFAVLSSPDSLQVFNNPCGGKFADVVISDLFGYAPDGGGPRLRDAAVPRGVTATLSGVFFQGVEYTITSDADGLSLS